VITSIGARAVRLPECPDLRKRLRLFLSLLERRDDSDVTGAHRLYRDLLSSPVGVLPDTVTTLIVVPDGPLHRVPFGALVDAAGTRVAGRYALTVIPSATTWLRWRGAGQPATRPSALIAFADPASRADGGDDGLRGELGPLRHARREAVMLRRHLGNGEVLQGEDATEAALKSADLSRYGMIHLAPHALVNDEYPERSAVLLATGVPDGDEDGALHFDEVIELDLDGQVVVLSACRSASGPLIGGEGVMGLANAFFLAGARTVVAGLWPVRDRETAALVERFGGHLGDGRSVAEALTLARRDLIRRGSPPAAWAGMVVLGDGDTVPLTGGSSRLPTRTIALIAALAIVVVAGASIFVGRLRSRRSNS
jgi:CHAT domain-containing protein